MQVTKTTFADPFWAFWAVVANRFTNVISTNQNPPPLSWTIMKSFLLKEAAQLMSSASGGGRTKKKGREGVSISTHSFISFSLLPISTYPQT